MYDASEAETEQAPSRTKADKRMDTPPLGNPRAKRQAEGEATQPKGGGGGSAFIGILFAVLMIGGLGALGWAGWKGPLKDTGLGQAMHKALEDEPPPPPPKDLKELAANPGGPKPQWLVEKEAHDAQLKAEAERQKAIEEASADPENQKILEEINSQLKDLDRQENELRQLKLDAKATGAQGAANSKKIEQMQKQIDDLKAAIEGKQGKIKKKKTEDGIEIVRDAKSAKSADIGYLTLYTVNPSKASVYEGSNSLGTTPLAKVPLDDGTHFLRIIDGDSQARSFTVTIKAGQTTELKGVDVSSMNLIK
jgi:uncharacterized protein YggU (UPF0235/DUF167 family)